MLNDTMWGVISIVIAISGSIWSLAWWLSGHFNNLRKDFALIAKEIIEKLEYHERHDDVRFSSLHNDIWEMKVRNAAVKGIVMNSKGPSTPVVLELKEHFKEERD